MIPLDSPLWAKLKHAYGSASDVPKLLKQLSELPIKDDYQSEPYFTLWSSLCHQDDVFSASYAAVPHIIEAAFADPLRAPDDCFQLPACIEIARRSGRGHAIQDELKGAYFAALGRLPLLAAKAAEGEWSEERLLMVLAAIAAAKGQPDLSRVIMELDPDTIQEVLDSKFD